MSIVNNINIKNNANISSKIRCEKVKSKKGDVFLLIIISNNNFEKHIPFLIQATLPNQTWETYIVATIIADIGYKRRGMLTALSDFQNFVLFSGNVKNSSTGKFSCVFLFQVLPLVVMTPYITLFL